MIFDSYEFALFFIIVYTIYLSLRRVGAQNWFLLGASYFFYGFWSWKFLLLLLGTQIIDFHIGKALDRLDDPGRRKKLMWLSVIVNMGTLGFFKYFNFFTENLREVLNLFGLPISDVTLNIVLPVGISFYTIQEVTYILDIYRRRTRAVHSFRDFSLFVSFFPQLMAGPIERAERLIPQIQSSRVITRQYLYEGGWLLFWGLFKKVFVADRLALFVDPIFAAPDDAAGPMVFLATVGFTVQIYADFSGYSDMAIGMGRLMGFNLMQNFNLPFFATSPSDFWRRWHISLSQCLRDNLYIPLGGNRYGLTRELSALMITMLIGGLWHGAQWHFVLWGAYCGGLLVLERIIRLAAPSLILRPQDDSSPILKRLLHITVMFPLTVIGFLIFRAETVSDIGILISQTFSGWDNIALYSSSIREVLFCTTLLACYQILHYAGNDRFVVFRLPAPIRVILYFTIYLLMVLAAPNDIRSFIYFQF